MCELGKARPRLCFKDILTPLFLFGGKRTRSSVIRKDVTQRTVNQKRTVMDLRSLDRDVLVISVKEKKQVLYSCKRATVSIKLN